jgi:hypothetical protein
MASVATIKLLPLPIIYFFLKKELLVEAADKHDSFIIISHFNSTTVQCEHNNFIITKEICSTPVMSQ